MHNSLLSTKYLVNKIVIKITSNKKIYITVYNLNKTTYIKLVFHFPLKKNLHELTEVFCIGL